MSSGLMPHISILVHLQCQLIRALFNQFGPIDRFCFTVPSRGGVEACDEKWEFTKHGLGVKFVSSGGLVVDCHKNLDHSECFDAWRLSIFLESQGIDCIELGGERIGVEEREIASCLENLISSGEIKRADIEGVYRL